MNECFADVQLPHPMSLGGKTRMKRRACPELVEWDLSWTFVTLSTTLRLQRSLKIKKITRGVSGDLEISMNFSLILLTGDRCKMQVLKRDPSLRP
jgi:hypothetical protein